ISEPVNRHEIDVQRIDTSTIDARADRYGRAGGESAKVSRSRRRIVAVVLLESIAVESRQGVEVVELRAKGGNGLCVHQHGCPDYVDVQQSERMPQFVLQNATQWRWVLESRVRRVED